MILIFEKGTAIKIIGSIFGPTAKIQQFCLNVTRKSVTRKSLRKNCCHEGYQLKKSYMI